MPVRVPLRFPMQPRPQRPATPVEAAADVPRVIRGTTTIPAGNRPRYECDVVIPYYRGLQWSAVGGRLRS